MNFQENDFQVFKDQCMHLKVTAIVWDRNNDCYCKRICYSQRKDVIRMSGVI